MQKQYLVGVRYLQITVLCGLIVIAGRFFLQHGTYE